MTSSQHTLHGELADVLRDSVRDILPDVRPETVSLDQTFDSLGADSVDQVEILTRLLDHLGIDEPLSAQETQCSFAILIDSLVAAAGRAPDRHPDS